MEIDNRWIEVCPKGHIGRGILQSLDRVNCADGSASLVHHFECELCGEKWIEDDCEDDDYFDPATHNGYTDPDEWAEAMNKDDESEV